MGPDTTVASLCFLLFWMGLNLSVAVLLVFVASAGSEDGEVVSIYQAVCQKRSLITSIFGYEPGIIVIDQRNAPEGGLDGPNIHSLTLL